MDATAAAEVFSLVLAAYLALGVVFAIAFVAKGAAAIDPAARDGTWGFRVMIFPGAVLLWPALARRWFGGRHAPAEERNAHRRAAEARR